MSWACACIDVFVIGKVVVHIPSVLCWRMSVLAYFVQSESEWALLIIFMGIIITITIIITTTMAIIITITMMLFSVFMSVYYTSCS